MFWLLVLLRERAVKQTEDDLHRNQNNGAAMWNGPSLPHKQTHESCLNNLVYINKSAVNYPTESSLAIIIKPLCGSRAMFAKYKDKTRAVCTDTDWNVFTLTASMLSSRNHFGGSQGNSPWKATNSEFSSLGCVVGRGEACGLRVLVSSYL